MNLFKRFCAVITIIAIIASFGVTAFATGATVSFVGEPLVAKTSTAGVYEITVTYTASENLGDMGLTMLTYVGNVAEDDPSTEDSEFTPYDPDDDTMTIVGINQWGKNELPDADNVAENGNQIKFNAKMAEGATGLVMLGGDGVDAAAIELFTAPWAAKFATYTGGALAVNVAYPYGDEEKEAAILDAIVATNIQVSGENGNTAMVTGLGAELTAEDITIAIESDEDTSATHTVSFVLPEGTTLDNDKATLADNVTVTIPVCVTNTPWSVDEIAFGNGTAVVDSVENPSFATADAFLEYVTTNIVKTGSATLTLTGKNEEAGSYTIAEEDENVDVAWDVDGDKVADSEAPAAIEVGEAYGMIVTLKTTADLGENITALAGDKAASLVVTYQEDMRAAITAIDVTKDDAAVTATVVPEAATKAEIVAAVKAALEGATYTATYEGGTEVVTVAVPEDVADWTITDAEDVEDTTDEETDLAAGNYYATFEVTGLNGTNCKVVNAVTIKIAVTVSEPWTYGDVDGDGNITTRDLGWLRRRLVNQAPDGFIEEAANMHRPATTGVNTADLGILRKRLANQLTDDDLPVE